MPTEPTEPSEIRFFDAIRLAYQEGWTGRLGLNSADLRGQLFFVGGDLYVSPEHPFEASATAWANTIRALRRQSESKTEVEQGSAETSESVPASQDEVEARLATKRLTTELTDLLEPCAREACHFVDGAGQIRLDLIGPLPTGRLVMETSVRGEDEGGLLRQLGGAESTLVLSSADDRGPSGLELNPQEAFLLSRLEEPLSVGDLVQQMNVERLESLQALCQLLAVGLIRRQSDSAGSAQTSSFGAELVRRFAERIADSLEKEPVSLATEEHRVLLGNLLGRMGDMTFFELLAVSPQSEVDEVHRAFMELGRLVHPSHATRLALAGGERALGLLLERATEAYFTLSDSERRAEYFEKVGPLQINEGDAATVEERQEEMKALARRNFQLARNLADRQEFHAAIQLLEQAVKDAPESEYLALLAECQSYNPRWLDRAVQNMWRAVELRPHDGSLRLRLGSLQERRGDTNGAREQYELALDKGPDVIAARESLDRLRSRSGPKAAEKKGLSQTIRALFNRGTRA
ncbi:MAG: J domain-containing protein [Thermoanaerobaculia bacterium]